MQEHDNRHINQDQKGKRGMMRKEKKKFIPNREDDQNVKRKWECGLDEGQNKIEITLLLNHLILPIV